MDREEYVNIISKVAGNIWDSVNSGAGKIDVGILYMDTYNGGELNQKLCYAKEGDSGFDLRAANNEQKGYQINPGGTIVVPTGVKVAVSKGFELQVRTRSGTPLKRGFNVANSPGTVDCITKDTLLDTNENGKIPLSDLMKMTDPTCLSFNEETQEYENDEIVKIWSVGEKEVIRFEMEDGSWFECTKNQQILTKNSGWKSADMLRVDDELM